MRLNYEVKPVIKKNNSRLMEMVFEFEHSGKDVAEVEDFSHKDATICANDIRQAIKRCKVPQIGVTQRNGHVYLFRKEM